MQTISAEEFKKKYGTVGLAQLSEPKPTAGQRISNAFKSGVEQVKSGVATAANAKNPVELFRGSAKIGAGAINAASSPLAPVVEPTIGKAIDFAGNNAGKNPFGGSGALADDPKFQNFANSPAGESTSRVAEDVVDLTTIAGAVAGPKVGGKVANKVGSAVSKVGKEIGSEIAKAGEGGLAKILPVTTEAATRYTNTLSTKALRLTEGDVRNIRLSTGNEVGQFLADNNLIQNTPEATQKGVKDYFSKNYDMVREEVGKVINEYKPSQVPRYVESLKAIQKKIENVPGLQEASVEVDNLLNKQKIALNDVQRVKELIDEHFNLYKNTGDVGEGVAKAGLDNIRKDLKGFIEQEVKNTTGSDIGMLNNNVSTAKGILDAIESRSTRGVTKAMVSPGDFGAFLSGTVAFGNPFTGIAALFIKKLMESPSVQLKVAKFFDSLSDSRKASVVENLNTGKIPPEFNQFIKKKK